MEVEVDRKSRPLITLSHPATLIFYLLSSKYKRERVAEALIRDPNRDFWAEVKKIRCSKAGSIV